MAMTKKRLHARRDMMAVVGAGVLRGAIVEGRKIALILLWLTLREVCCLIVDSGSSALAV